MMVNSYAHPAKEARYRCAVGLRGLQVFAREGGTSYGITRDEDEAVLHFENIDASCVAEANQTPTHNCTISAGRWHANTSHERWLIVGALHLPARGCTYVSRLRFWNADG